MKLVFFTLILLTMTNTIFLPEAHAQSKDEQAVASAVENLRKALIDPDKTTLDGLVLDELTYGHSNGNLQDKAAFEEALGLLALVEAIPSVDGSSKAVRGKMRRTAASSSAHPVKISYPGDAPTDVHSRPCRDRFPTGVTNVLREGEGNCVGMIFVMPYSNICAANPNRTKRRNHLLSVT